MFWKQLPRLWLTSASRLNNFRSVNTNPVRCMNEGPLQRPTGLSGGKKFDDDPTKGRGPVSWINLAVTGAAVAVMIGTYVYVRDTKRAELDKERKREIGKSKIGGTFLLNDQYGKPCGTKDLLGKWVLLYFGFTHCPDICPDEMEKMATVYDNIKAAGAKEKNVGDIVPVFITVDPERDTVAAVREYVKEFHPDIVGLSGTEEQIKTACKAFRVYFSAGPRDDEDDYIVDHTIIIYLLDPEGNFVDYYGQRKTANDITTSVRVQMTKFAASQRTSLFG